MNTLYDVVIIGGGAGGLQSAIHMGRYGWKTLVIDRGKGRTFYSPVYHNLLGFPEGISGAELLMRGKKQAKKYGVEFLNKIVIDVIKDESGMFTITAQRRKEFREHSNLEISIIHTRKLVIATGIMDQHPNVPNVYHWAGYSIYYCPDCDGYELRNKRVVVVGKGDGVAKKALMLLNWTRNMTIVNVDTHSAISPNLLAQLSDYNITIYQSELKEFSGSSRDRIEKVILQDGTEIVTDLVFSSLGMYSVNSELGSKLGIKTLDNGHIIVDARTKETSVRNVWAVGDIVAHSQQVMIAMGDGAQAAIWINKSLRGDGLLPQIDLIDEEAILTTN